MSCTDAACYTCVHILVCVCTWVCRCVLNLALPRSRWGSTALQMGERVKTSDDDRADHSQPRELLTLIISHWVDVGLSFVLCSINCPTLPGQLSTVSSLSRSGATGTQRHTQNTQIHTFLVTPWLLVHSVQMTVPSGGSARAERAWESLHLFL